MSLATKFDALTGRSTMTGVFAAAAAAAAASPSTGAAVFGVGAASLLAKAFVRPEGASSDPLSGMLKPVSLRGGDPRRGLAESGSIAMWTSGPGSLLETRLVPRLTAEGRGVVVIHKGGFDPSRTIEAACAMRREDDLFLADLRDGGFGDEGHADELHAARRSEDRLAYIEAASAGEDRRIALRLASLMAVLEEEGITEAGADAGSALRIDRLVGLLHGPDRRSCREVDLALRFYPTYRRERGSEQSRSTREAFARDVAVLERILAPLAPTSPHAGGRRVALDDVVDQGRILVVRVPDSDQGLAGDRSHAILSTIRSRIFLGRGERGVLVLSDIRLTETTAPLLRLLAPGMLLVTADSSAGPRSDHGLPLQSVDAVVSEGRPPPENALGPAFDRSFLGRMTSEDVFVANRGRNGMFTRIA